MSPGDITPELLRSVASWLRANAVGALPGKPLAAEFLDGAADDLEREQAYEKRIDELAKVCYRAESEFVGNIPAWDLMPKSIHETYYAGIRAVLAHIDGSEREPRTWNDLRDVPADVKRIVGSNSSLVAYRDESAEHGWMWDLRQHDPAPVSELGLTYSAPFMEAPDDV